MRPVRFVEPVRTVFIKLYEQKNVSDFWNYARDFDHETASHVGIK